MDNELTRPAPYRVAERTEWIACEDEGMEGFAILVRTAITNAEQAVLRARNDEIEGPYSEAWNAQTPEERDMDVSPWARQRALMAPYILDWNAQGQDAESGDWRSIPAPAVSGAEAFDAVTFREALWCLEVVVGGYYLTGKAGAWRNTSASSGSGSEATTAAPDPPPTGPSPKRRRSSRTPSKSASKG